MTQMEWWTVGGTIASVAGFLLDLYVLDVAKGAREAAQDARVLARKYNLAEELEQTMRFVEQVGDYVRRKEWEAARIRSQEVMTSCSESLRRWPDGLSEQRRNDMLTVSSLVRSIAGEASSPLANDFTAAKLKRLSQIQLQAAELLSGALGEARSHAERHGN